jgi:predicted nucleic acid-binding protein
MEARYLLDANIVIYIRQKHPEAALRRFGRLRPGEAGISVIAYGELLCGAMKSSQRESGLERLRELSTLLPPLPMPEKAAEMYGFIRADLESKGESDRQQRPLDRRSRPGLGSHSGHEQRKGIPESTKLEGAELGGVANSPDFLNAEFGLETPKNRKGFPTSLVYNN